MAGADRQNSDYGCIVCSVCALRLSVVFEFISNIESAGSDGHFVIPAAFNSRRLVKPESSFSRVFPKLDPGIRRDDGRKIPESRF
jgi:hypothetical protein